MNTVVQVVQHLSPGGIEVMALEMLRLQQSKIKMVIVSLEGDKQTALNKWSRLRQFSDSLYFLNKQPGWSVKTMRNLKELFLSLDADAIHTHHIGPLIYGGIAARMAGIKTWVHTEHDAWHLENKKRRMLESLMCKLLSPKMVADSQLVANSLSHHLGLKDVSVVRNGVDVEKFYPGDKAKARRRFKLPLTAKIVGCAGRMELEKGHSVLLEALTEMPINVHLALAGSGSQELALRKLAKELHIKNRIHFLGHVEDMVGFYQSLDVFCLPSFKEGMPLAPLEAQACGIPTVLTDTGACAESICKKSGSLVKPGAVYELADAILRTLDVKRLHNPRNYVCTHANAVNMAEGYSRLCNPVK